MNKNKGVILSGKKEFDSVNLLLGISPELETDFFFMQI
jgi:hypothetical protein